MDQIKVAADLSKEETLAQDSTKANNDVRTLSDLEMVMCGGGDGILCW